METSDRSGHQEPIGPAWEQDPQVRRALAAALEPEGKGALATEVALHELRALIDEQPPRSAVPRRARLGIFGSQSLQRGIAWVGARTSWGSKVPTAIAALLVLLAFFWARQPQRDFGTTHTYSTAIGQRATLLLDDGTHVTMAPQTTLRLVQFGQSARTIVLDGDAYFDVSSSSRAPFIVKTGASTTRVLGTSFEVRHYLDGHEMRVAVSTGKVLVSSGVGHSAVTITAGQVLSITDSTQIVKTVDNIDTEIGWLGDRLVFQNAPVTKILETLTRWYGYEFRYPDSAVVRKNVTMGLSMQSSTEALATLEQILDVSLTVVGDTVTLTPAHGRTESHQRAKHYDVWLPKSEVGR